MLAMLSQQSRAEHVLDGKKVMTGGCAHLQLSFEEGACLGLHKKRCAVSASACTLLHACCRRILAYQLEQDGGIFVALGSRLMQNIAQQLWRQAEQLIVSLARIVAGTAAVGLD